MKINILQEGDSVISVTNELVAIQRRNGEVDLLKLLITDGRIRVDQENVVTISYGSNTTIENVNGVEITCF